MQVSGIVRNPAALGTIIYQARIESDLSQSALARKLGVSKQLVWDAENGHPTKAVERLFALLSELGVTLTATLEVQSTLGKDGNAA